MSESIPNTAALPTGRIAYVVAAFPLASETFVYREVRELRRRGWKLITISLNDVPPMPAGYADLIESRTVLYGSGLAATLGNAVLESLTHPIRSIKTMLLALRDLFNPGEKTPIATRLKFPVQGVIALGLARRLRNAGVQWIHCHFAHSSATVGMYAAMQLGIPFSFTGHANDLFQRRALLCRKLERATFVACISRWHGQWYQSIYPQAAAKCELVRCGVEPKTWHPADQSESNDQFRIVTVCRLVEKKGVDTLIEAFRELKRHGVAATLTIAGAGPRASHLRALAAAIACDPIEWLGEVDNARVPELLAGADVLALPCRADLRGDRDGIPVVLMEAMSCGLPVISGDLPAIRELIDDGVSGILVPGGDRAALCEALAKLAADPRLRHELGNAGRKKVEAEFSLSANVDRLEARFRSGMK